MRTAIICISFTSLKKKTRFLRMLLVICYSQILLYWDCVGQCHCSHRPMPYFEIAFMNTFIVPTHNIWQRALTRHSDTLHHFSFFNNYAAPYCVNGMPYRHTNECYIQLSRTRVHPSHICYGKWV